MFLSKLFFISMHLLFVGNFSSNEIICIFAIFIMLIFIFFDLSFRIIPIADGFLGFNHFSKGKESSP